MKQIEFPEIFITGKLPKDWTKNSLISDGLVAWASCMIGIKPPPLFGEAMALIAQIVGTATPKGLSEEADKIIKATRSGC